MKVFFDNIILRLKEIFDLELLGGKFAQVLANLIVGLIILIAFYIGWRIVRLMVRPGLKRSGADETTISFVETLIKYILMIIAIITALDSMGIQMGAVLASMGIAGLTIGFAARDSLSNLISGILIFLDRPFVIGDLVEIDGSYGKVDKITLRSTRIITTDGRMLAVPNTEVINKTVASYTNFPHLMLNITVTVGINEDIERIRELLLGLVKDNPEYLQDPAPRVVVTELGDYNNTIQLQVWLSNERQHVEKRFDLREKVFKTLSGAGIDMPFETISITPLEVKHN